MKYERSSKARSEGDFKPGRMAILRRSNELELLQNHAQDELRFHESKVLANTIPRSIREWHETKGTLAGLSNPICKPAWIEFAHIFSPQLLVQMNCQDRNREGHAFGYVQVAQNQVFQCSTSNHDNRWVQAECLVDDHVQLQQMQHLYIT